MIQPYSKFFLEHGTRAAKSSPVADVGIVYDYLYALDDYCSYGFAQPWEATEKSHLLALQAGQTLEGLHVLFDYIYLGDGIFRTRKLDFASLSGLKALIIPETVWLEGDEQIPLNRFVLNGGKIITYRDGTDPKTLLAGLPDGASRIATSSGENIGMELEKGSDKYFLHLYNYDYDGHDFTDASGINVSIDTTGILSASPTLLKAIAPGEPDAEVSFTFNNGILKFAIDKIHIYKQVEIVP